MTILSNGLTNFPLQSNIVNLNFMGTPYFCKIDIVQEINCLTYNWGYIFMEFNLQQLTTY